MISITDAELEALANQPDQQKTKREKISTHPVLDLPFRSYFLLAVAGSTVSIVFWLAFLNGWLSGSINDSLIGAIIPFSLFTGTGLSPTIWHIHEMIFGFAATVAVGFILTAAQTWTGKSSIKGLPVLAFIILWLVIRLCLWVNQPSAIYLAIILQTLWWLGAIIVYSTMVLGSGNKRNYIFMPLLFALMVMNINILALAVLGYTALSVHFSRTAVLLFCLLMGVLAGRVIPFFTAAGARVEVKTQPVWLTPLLTTVSVLGILIFFINQFIALPFTPAPLLIGAGGLHLFRQYYWRTVATIKIPLLWSLHLAYASLGFGLILLGLSYLSLNSFYLSFGDALHLITIGAMGLMIFAMMARVSLGHTGRALTPHKRVPWIFILMLLSALARVILPAFQQSLLGWNLSGLLWLVAGIIFLIIYHPILTRKRIDSE